MLLYPPPPWTHRSATSLQVFCRTPNPDVLRSWIPDELQLEGAGLFSIFFLQIDRILELPDDYRSTESGLLVPVFHSPSGRRGATWAVMFVDNDIALTAGRRSGGPRVSRNRFLQFRWRLHGRLGSPTPRSRLGRTPLRGERRPRWVTRRGLRTERVIRTKVSETPDTEPLRRRRGIGLSGAGHSFRCRHTCATDRSRDGCHHLPCCRARCARRCRGDRRTSTHS